MVTLSGWLDDVNPRFVTLQQAYKLYDPTLRSKVVVSLQSACAKHESIQCAAEIGLKHAIEWVLTFLDRTLTPLLRRFRIPNRFPSLAAVRNFLYEGKSRIINKVSFAKISARFEEYLDTNTVDEMGEPLIKTTSSNTAKSREVGARQREEQSSASYMGLYDQANKQDDLDKRLAQQFKGGVIPLQSMVPKVKG